MFKKKTSKKAQDDDASPLIQPDNPTAAVATASEKSVADPSLDPASSQPGTSSAQGDMFASSPVDVPYVIPTKKSSPQPAVDAPHAETVPDVPITVDSPVPEKTQEATKQEQKDAGKQAPVTKAPQPKGPVAAQSEVPSSVVYAPQLKQSHGVDFVTIVSHQLRTPLTGIKWYVDLLLSGQAGNVAPRQQDYLLDIHQANERMIRLVDNLLIIEQLENKKLNLVARTAYLPELVTGITSEYDAYVKVHGISLVSQCPNAQRAKVKIDPIYIRLALKNVIDNALRYTPEGGTVAIECSYVSPENDPEITQPMAQVSISDTGIGIPPEDRAEVFKKFYRSQQSMTMQTEGTGLGLFITKVIIEKSGGRIWFTSKGDASGMGASGKKETGTNFFIQLPIVA